MTRQQSTRASIFFGLILAFSVAAGCGGVDEDIEGVRTASDEDVETATESIRMILNKQQEAWNQGSIRAYMEGYAEMDTLRFASGGDVWYGWDKTLQRYEETYIDEGMMGTLSFDDVDIRLLSSEYALVFGRWGLSRSEAYADVGGLFTLVFEKRPEGWRIIHDHTSSRNPAASDTLITD